MQATSPAILILIVVESKKNNNKKNPPKANPLYLTKKTHANTNEARKYNGSFARTSSHMNAQEQSATASISKSD